MGSMLLLSLLAISVSIDGPDELAVLPPPVWGTPVNT